MAHYLIHIIQLFVWLPETAKLFKLAFVTAAIFVLADLEKPQVCLVLWTMAVFRCDDRQPGWKLKAAWSKAATWGFAINRLV